MAVTEPPFPLESDPRVTADLCRQLTRGSGQVVLVGVVHDHPASCVRVRRVAQALEPETVCLELPPTTVHRYRETLESTDAARTTGGEMGVAMQATPEATHVGIDGLDTRFLRTLASTVTAQRPAVRTLARTARGVGTMAKQLLGSQLRVWGNEPDTGIDVEQFESLRGGSPELQAADERRQLERSASFLRAVETPAAISLREETRETCMAHRLVTCLEDGPVLAVLGMDHLDPVADNVLELTEAA